MRDGIALNFRVTGTIEGSTEKNSRTGVCAKKVGNVRFPSQHEVGEQIYDCGASWCRLGRRGLFNHRDSDRNRAGRRLNPFQAIHLLHALAKGIGCIHVNGEYHGDLRLENIIHKKYGLNFEPKLLDLYHWGKPDVVDLIRIFYDVLGGQKYYAKQCNEIKQICCELKQTLINRKFRTAEQLRTHLEQMSRD